MFSARAAEQSRYTRNHAANVLAEIERILAPRQLADLTAERLDRFERAAPQRGHARYDSRQGPSISRHRLLGDRGGNRGPIDADRRQRPGRFGRRTARCHGNMGRVSRTTRPRSRGRLIIGGEAIVPDHLRSGRKLHGAATARRSDGPEDQPVSSVAPRTGKRRCVDRQETPRNQGLDAVGRRIGDDRQAAGDPSAASGQGDEADEGPSDHGG